MNTPDWLSKRGGELEKGYDGRSVYLSMNRQPQFRLRAISVDGQYGCAIMQTNNSKPIPCDAKAAHEEAAIHAGLETLKTYLGW